MQMTISTLMFDPKNKGVEYISISDFMEEEQKGTSQSIKKEEQN